MITGGLKLVIFTYNAVNPLKSSQINKNLGLVKQKFDFWNLELALGLQSHWSKSLNNVLSEMSFCYIKVGAQS